MSWPLPHLAHANTHALPCFAKSSICFNRPGMTQEGRACARGPHQRAELARRDHAAAGRQDALGRQRALVHYLRCIYPDVEEHPDLCASLF